LNHHLGLLRRESPKYQSLTGLPTVTGHSGNFTALKDHFVRDTPKHCRPPTRNQAVLLSCRTARALTIRYQALRQNPAKLPGSNGTVVKSVKMGTADYSASWAKVRAEQFTQERLRHNQVV